LGRLQLFQDLVQQKSFDVDNGSYRRQPFAQYSYSLMIGD